MNTISKILPVTLMTLGSIGSGITPIEVHAQNPFLKPANNKFGITPFQDIKLADYKEAFDKGILEQKDIINKIVTTKAAPNFENTIVALENSDELLRKVSSIFYNMLSANSNDDLEKLSNELASKMSQHSDDIYLNKALFNRVKKVHDNIDKLKLNDEQKKLLSEKYKSFVRSGANLNAEDQNKLRAINEKLSLSTLKFGQNVLNETNNYELLVDNINDLKGLPESLIKAAAASAEKAGKKGTYRFTLTNSSVKPFLQYADNRELRKQIYTAYVNKANNNNEFDNKNVVAEIVRLRAAKANLLGYKNHASYVLEESMAKTPEQVYELLNKLWEATVPVAQAEAKSMTDLMNKSGVQGELQAWDWDYYADKVKKERYSLNEEEVKQYFEINNVRQGIFTLVDKLYGVKFTPLTDVPKYEKDVTAWEVKEADGTVIGVLYMDMQARTSKRSGAWMTSFRDQSYNEKNQKVLPLISIVCNFPASINTDDAVLLTPDEVTTFFHEFGHALHGLLSNVKYNSLSGTNVSRDFVELPSQVMEHWAFEPELLALYAKDNKTGKVIPSELVEKLDAASKFNQGFGTSEYLAAALLDMNYHTLSEQEATNLDIANFENEKLQSIGLISQIAPRYKSTYFQHIFSGGYSAGYYSYIWSEVLDSDAFATYKESGNIFNKEIAKKFRTNILEKGGTDDPMNMYKKFKGKTPDVKYLLQNRGLK